MYKAINIVFGFEAYRRIDQARFLGPLVEWQETVRRLGDVQILRETAIMRESIGRTTCKPAKRVSVHPLAESSDETTLIAQRTGIEYDQVGELPLTLSSGGGWFLICNLDPTRLCGLSKMNDARFEPKNAVAA